MEIKPVIEHEPPHKGIKSKAQASEEVGNKYDTLVGFGRRDDLPWSRKPMLDVGSQISAPPKLCNVLLCDQGGHPPALRVGSGHDWEAWND